MHEAWLAQGNGSERLMVSDADHFSLLRQWASLEGALAVGFTRWWSAVLARRQT